jgi:hypothetical protein
MPTARQALPLMRMAKNNPTRIADGDDHAVISLGYFLSGWRHWTVPQSEQACSAILDAQANRIALVVGSESVKQR